MKVRQDALDAVLAHARECAPEECCGILLARGSGRAVVNAVLQARNVERTRRRSAYVLGHQAHLEAVRREAAGDGRILGYYHSHPAGPVQPSQRDAELACAGLAYLIVGLANADVEFGAWRFERGRWAPEPVEVSR